MNAPVPLQHPLPTGAAVQEINCLACKKPMALKVPIARVFNGPDVSVLAFAHEKLDMCPHCSQLYLFMLNPFDADGQLSFKWSMVHPVKPPSMIASATDADMKQAVEDAKVADKMKTM